MRKTKGNSLLETRRQNRVLIKNLIFKTENVTRTMIANELSLTLPTITTTVNEMLAEGILEELPIRNMPTKGAGRRPTTIVFRADMAYTIGVELGPYFCSIVLLNMRAQIIDKKIIKSPNETYTLMLHEVCDGIRALITKERKNKIIGIGVGLPGFVHVLTGIVRNNPRHDWNMKPLARDIEKEIGIKTVIDNNVRIRALGFDISKMYITNEPFAYLYASKGISCPLMVRDGIIYGNGAGAGELGETILNIDLHTGDYKRVDELAGERAIFEACQSRMLEGKLHSLRDIIAKKSFFTIEDVLHLQIAGDKEIDAIVTQAVHYLGLSLSNVVNLVNPKFVVIDAYIMKYEKNRETLKKEARKFFFGLNEDEIVFIFHDFDELWGAKSAALLAISLLYLDA